MSETGAPESPETPEQMPDVPPAAAPAGPALPPGFDAGTYLALNPDVAASGGDPGAHYAEFGQFELRAVLVPGQGLTHPESRMLDDAARADWMQALRARAADLGGLDAVLDAHPRVAWLDGGFGLGAYLRECQDVANAVSDPLEAAFHYLEFGIEEGRLGRPETWDSGFVKARHGLAFDPGLSARDVLARLLAMGNVTPLDAALDEPQYWELRGVCGGQVSTLFDHEYYHASMAQNGQTLPAHDRIACIDHFIAHGIAADQALGHDQIFDPAFYRGQFDAHMQSLLPDALYRHWLDHGLRHSLSPNLQIWARHDLGLDLPQELGAQLKVFGLSAGLDPNMAPQNMLRALVKTPRPGLAQLDLSSPDSVDFVVTLAAQHTKAKTAIWLYWLALGYAPQHARAVQGLVDLLADGSKHEALWLLRNQTPDGVAAYHNILSLAEICLKARRVDEAATALASLPDRALADVEVTRKKRKLAHQLFYRIWKNLGPHVAAYGIERTQDQLRAALAAATPAFSTAALSRPVRHVALVGNEDLYQCKLYRVDQKAEQLREAGFKVTVISPNLGLDGFCHRIEDFDAVIFFRVPAFPPMIDAMVLAAQNGLLTFYEVDDIIFDTAHFPPAYDTYAEQITPEHYAAMACGVPLFEHAMALCDYGIASTATIAGLMQGRVRSGQVFEHHNALGRLHLKALETVSLEAKAQDPSDDFGPEDETAEDGAPLVLFYGSGTRAHKEDFHDLLEPALAEMLRRHPGRIEIRLIGHFGTFRHLDPGRDPVTVMEPVWDFEEYCGRVAQADINLSVLRPTLLTDAKSEIKWMEAALFGIPSIVSDTATHREVIAEGETGFLAADADGFTTALERLITDPDLRAQVGQAARDKVLAEYSLPAMGAGLRNMFESLRPEGVQKKRLMVVNVFYPPQAIGGATRVVHDNVTLLRERYGDAYEIDVVCTLEGGGTPFEVTSYAQDGVRVWAITAPPHVLGDMEPRDARMGDAFEQLVDRLSPDLIHYHCVQRLTASVVDVARLRDIPYVITLHDAWWISPNQFVIDDRDQAEFYDFDSPERPARAQALARPLRGAARLLAVSEPFAELHRARGLDNVVVVENGVSPLPACPRVPSQSGRVRLAHIGGASRHKGVHLVRNALRAGAYAHLELLLIDHAMAPGRVRHETWGTTPVTISGKVAQSQITDLYAQTDILLAPSIWPESYGLVSREAMTMGAWVIAGDQGAIGADIVEGVNGHRIDVSTYAALADILSHVDADPGRYRRSPGDAPAMRSVADQVDALAQLYAQVLSERD